MPNFKPLTLSEPAKKDLQAIADYTLEQWGETQKSRYLALIQKSFVSLSTLGNIGKQRDDIATGLYAYTIKQHCVYFREEAAEFVVIRVLHQRMDVAQHLDE